MATSDISGKAALVTGAASGIGLAIAQELAGAGVRVVAVDRDAPGLSAADLPGSCVRVAGDITAAAVRESLLARGPFPLSVQCAAVADREPGVLRENDAERRAIFETNLFAPWTFSRDLARQLIASGTPGAMVMISSLHAARVRRLPAYSVSKAALEMLVRELAWELGPHGIRVNALAPGGVDSSGSASGAAQQEKIFPLGRVQRPADVARMCLVLLDDSLSGQTTGTTVKVDGGLDLFSWHARGDER